MSAGMFGQFDQSSYFAASAQQYAPMATATPPPYLGGLNIPGMNPALALPAQMMLGPLMNRAGLVPLFTHDQNIYATMRSQLFYQQQMDMSLAMRQQEQVNITQTVRGMAALLNRPFTKAMEAQTAIAARDISAIAPIMAMVAPDLLESFGGMRGSPTVMATRMWVASRGQIDPYTGKLGRDMETVRDQASQLFTDMYGPNASLATTRGIRAGELGQMYEQLSARGMMPGFLGPQDMLNQALPGQAGTALLRSAAGRAGFQLPTDRSGGADLAALTSEQLTKLTDDSQVSAKLKAFDANRVKATLTGYLDAVNAMKDLFGSMGKTDAPMSLLVNALDQMTGGQLHQLRPDQLNRMVRVTGQLAAETGIGMDRAIQMQQALTGVTKQMGIEPIFAAQATQGAMAWGAGYRGSGPSWGRMNADQMMQTDATLRVSAAASQAGQRMGLVLRMSEAYGGFDPNSDAGRYVEALKTASQTGATKWAGGDLVQSHEQIARMLTGARGAGGQKLGITENQVNFMLTHETFNREQLQQYNLLNVVRRGQGPEVQRRVSDEIFKSQMQAMFGLTDAQATTAARQFTAQMWQTADSDLSTPASRGKVLGQALQTAVQAAGGQANQGDAWFRGRAEELYGQGSRVSDTMFQSGTLQNLINLHRPQLGASAERVLLQQDLVAQVHTAVAPLSGMGNKPLRAVMTYLQQAAEATPGSDKQGTAVGAVAAALGVANPADIAKTLMPHMLGIRGEQEELTKVIGELSQLNPEDPKQQRKYAELRGQYQTRLTSLRQHTAELQKQLGVYGLKTEGLDAADKAGGADGADAADKDKAGAASRSVSVTVTMPSGIAVKISGTLTTEDGRKVHIEGQGTTTGERSEGVSHAATGN